MKEVERIWSQNRELTEKAQEPQPPRREGSQLAASASEAIAEIIIRCPHCREQIVCDEKLSGTKVPCPKCQAEIDLPESPGRRVAQELGMNLNVPADAEIVRRVLLSTKATKIILNDTPSGGELEDAFPKLGAICGIAGALVGMWTANQSGVSLLSDSIDHQIWSGHSLLAHIIGGIFVGVASAFIIYFISVPFNALIRWFAGNSHQDRWSQFGLGIGRYLGMGIGGVIGAITSMGPHGSLLRGRLIAGFFLSHSAGRGFVMGGFIGGICLGLLCVVIGRMRDRRRHSSSS